MFIVSLMSARPSFSATTISVQWLLWRIDQALCTAQMVWQKNAAATCEPSLHGERSLWFMDSLAKRASITPHHNVEVDVVRQLELPQEGVPSSTPMPFEVHPVQVIFLISLPQQGAIPNAQAFLVPGAVGGARMAQLQRLEIQTGQETAW